MSTQSCPIDALRDVLSRRYLDKFDLPIYLVDLERAIGVLCEDRDQNPERVMSRFGLVADYLEAALWHQGFRPWAASLAVTARKHEQELAESLGSESAEQYRRRTSVQRRSQGLHGRRRMEARMTERDYCAARNVYNQLATLARDARECRAMGDKRGSDEHMATARWIAADAEQAGIDPLEGR